MTRHFLRDDDLSAREQGEVLALADTLKRDRFRCQPLAGPQTVAVLFDKPSTRTRISFAVAIADLGGTPLVIDIATSQLGRGEPVEDTTRVLHRQVAAIAWRTFGQERIESMAAVSQVPVVNALTDRFHPCQLLADLQTIREHHGTLTGLRLTYLGDGANNMAHSYLLAGATAGMHVTVGSPDELRPDSDVLQRAAAIAAETGGSVRHVVDPRDSVEGADAIATDTWVSMGKESDAREHVQRLTPYAVDATALAHASPAAVVLHCLPAYRGMEISPDVMDGPQSVVWDQAENRLHVQKALLVWLLDRAATATGSPTGPDTSEEPP
ncbi:MAG: ornithine carbamoyltransferase [Actinomycetota bacterium]|jgi:ornithine carbamoyltransferase|nr:ornithine carbamoyltransferase [Actinomycetota bacterium]